MSTGIDAVEAFSRTVAAWGLPGGPSILRVPIDDDATLAGRLEQHRLIGPLLAAAESGDVALTPGLEAELVERQHRALLWCIRLEVRLLEIRGWFDGAGGIGHLVIKGPAIAHLDAVDPSVRTFADVDLLVEGADLDRTVEILTAHGATVPWVERRPGFDRRFAKSVTVTFADGIEVDVHRMPADGVFGHRIPLERLFVRPDSFEIGGVGFRALNRTHRLLHSAYHVLLGSPEPALMNVRDLACYLTAGDLGPELVVPEVDRWRGRAVLVLAIDLVTDRLGVDLPEWGAWRATQDLDPAEVEMVHRHRREGSSLGRAKLDVARSMRPRERAAYLTALAWPSSAHLESRGLRRRDMLAPLRAALRPRTG